MSVCKKLTDYSTDELLYELLKLTRRQQWEADPLLFAREGFPQHFTKASATMHQEILRKVTGVGESATPTGTSLPFSPPVSAPRIKPDLVHGLNT